MNTIVQMEKIYKSICIGIVSCLFICILSSCGVMRPPVINNYDDTIHNYRYFYVSPTGDYSSSSATHGTKTINPTSIISGILLKNGFIQVNEVNPKNATETMLVNFGETGRRNINFGYSIEVTIQFVSAYSQHPICTCTAEGQGETEADDVREAIQRALEPLFKSKK